MEKNLYIDASHPNETRVVLKSNNNIEDYEYEGLKTNLIKNNIYLGKVSRIEPSLQAAFVDFGKDRHGFLSFNDIGVFSFFCFRFCLFFLTGIINFRSSGGSVSRIRTDSPDCMVC